MAPLVLSWYTLRRGRQTLWVTPAPAIAAAPYKNRLLLGSVPLLSETAETCVAVDISVVCTVTILLQNFHLHTPLMLLKVQHQEKQN